MFTTYSTSCIRDSETERSSHSIAEIGEGMRSTAETGESFASSDVSVCLGGQRIVLLRPARASHKRENDSQRVR